MLEQLLQWMGAGDQAIATMGPIVTIAIAMLGGGAFAQWVKYPLSVALADGWFRWVVRSLAIAVTTVLALKISDALPLWVCVAVGLAQPLGYHASVAVVRRFWPWLEVHAAVGSVDPPASAYEAQAQRQADGQDSGA